MASAAFGPVPTIIKSPASLLLFQLCSGSAVLGFTRPDSWLRLAALSLTTACVHGIVKDAATYMRPRWASLLGGQSFSFFLQFLDMALISRWSYESHGSLPNTPASLERDKTENMNGHSVKPDATRLNFVWQRFSWGWNTLLSFRHVDTPYEAPNTPPFSKSDPSYVPSKPGFIAQQIATAGICYIVLDLLAARPPSPNSAALFNPALIPIFRRIGDVTLAQIKLRAFSIAGFALTFYCVIQGFQSALAAITVGLGLSEPRSWRPPFGPLTEAYSLKNVWGKVWHQNLRRQITSPATYITRDILKLQPGSLAGRFTSLILSFAVSGLMHIAAGVAGGGSLKDLGVFQFFCTQAFGIMIEDTAVVAYRYYTRTNEKNAKRRRPSVVIRCLGYAWVVAYLTWSGPVWLYPHAARVPSAHSNNPTGFLPFSIIQAYKDRR